MSRGGTAGEKERALRRALADPGTVPRFWAGVAPEPTPEGCRLWVGRVTSVGDPTLYAGGHSVQPKRVAWFLARGEVASTGKMVPACGNPRCLEPAHLRWRTAVRRALTGG